MLDFYELNLKIKYISETNVKKKFCMKITSDRSRVVIKRVNKIINILNLLLFTPNNIRKEIEDVNFRIEINCYRERTGFISKLNKWKFYKTLRFSKITTIFN